MVKISALASNRDDLLTLRKGISHIEAGLSIYVRVNHAFIGWNMDMSPVWFRWANGCLSFISQFENNFSGILIDACRFSYKKYIGNVVCERWRFCLGLSVLIDLTFGYFSFCQWFQMGSMVFPFFMMGNLMFHRILYQYYLRGNYCNWHLKRRKFKSIEI